MSDFRCEVKIESGKLCDVDDFRFCDNRIVKIFYCNL